MVPGRLEDEIDVEAVFKELDADGDDSVSFAEFRRGFQARVDCAPLSRPWM